MRKRLILPLTALGCVAVAGGVVWLYRAPLVTHFVDRELAARGVEARYSIDHIGLRTQRLRNLSIGDPAKPDLTARTVEITVTLGITGPRIIAIRARGVRLRAYADATGFSMG
jgi:translocation and assembly module TamB